MTTTRAARWATLAAITAAGPIALAAFASPANADTPTTGPGIARPATFTHAFTATATPGEVGLGSPFTESNLGQPGASGTFTFLINLPQEIICWNITLNNVTGDYQSAAKTATHIHAAAAGTSGPPRIAFPNPTGSDAVKTSTGCAQGPFTTGLTPAGATQDSGVGFTLQQIVDNPAAFAADTHTIFTNAAGVVRTPSPGSVRGQLAADPAALAAANAVAATPAPKAPVRGVDTGDLPADGATPLALIALTGAAVLGAAGVASVRRRQGA